MSEPTLALGKGLTLARDLMTRATSVVGQRGTGKTSTAVVMIEEGAAAGVQFAVIDPTGAWYGLRSSKSGKGAGLEAIVFGGHNADLPLDAEAGAFMARLLVDERVSVVLDLELMAKSKQVQFVAEFASELYHRNRTALTLVIDEAHRFAPQQLREPGGFGAKCLGAVTDVVALGRRKGLGAVVISQRPATVNKDVFEQSEILIAHRLMGANDRKAIKGWLEEVGVDEAESGRLLARIPKLPVGHAMVYAPTYGIAGEYAVRMKHTFDSSATPEIGASVQAPVGRADVDLDAIRAAMAETIQRAAEDDPKVLRARIKELQEDRSMRGESDARVLRQERDRADAAEALVSQLRTDMAHGLIPPILGEQLKAALGNVIDAFVSEAKGLGEPLSVGDHVKVAVPVGGYSRARYEVEAEPRMIGGSDGRMHVAGTARVSVREVPEEGLGFLRAGARRMLAAAVSQHPRPLTRPQLGTLAGIKHSGGTYSQYLSNLKSAGFLVEEGGKLHVTDAGAEAIGKNLDAPATPGEIREMWRSKLRAGARRMLDVLIADRSWWGREALAEAAGITYGGGTFSSYLGQLRTAGLIDEMEGMVRASDVLFLAAS